jgi:iron complex outermembrane receptor protein
MLAVTGNAQTGEPGRYRGRVVSSSTSAGLGGAVVQTHPRCNRSVSDSAGYFLLQVPPGKYRISVGYAGYASQEKEIEVPGEGIFQLEEDTHQLDQVVVTAVTGATRIKRTPVAIAIVTRREMNRHTSTNIIDAVLKSVPGISALTTGPNISKPLIRGLGYTRVLTLYDGLRQEGQQWGDEHGIEIDQYGISRAEIVKGPASLMYGSDAIAGVVNLIPGIPAAENQKIHGDALTEYQSNNGMIGASLSLQQRGPNFFWAARTSLKSAGNYRNAIDGRVYNTGFNEVNGSLMIGWGKKVQNIVQANLYSNLQEIPDGSRDSASRHFTYQVHEANLDDIRNRPFVPGDALFTRRIAPLHQDIRHFRLYHKGNYMIGSGTLTTLFGFQQNNRSEFNHPTVPQQPGLDVRLNTWNYELKYNFHEVAGLQFSSGLNGMYQNNSNRNATDFPIPDYRLFDIGGYLVVKKEIDNMVFTGGFRADLRSVDWENFYTRTIRANGFTRQATVPDTAGATLTYPAYKRRFTGISGSIGMVYNLSPATTIKANLARGYRCPSITEIGSNGLDPGARIYYIGNRDFEPEFNWQGDIGLFLNYPDADFSMELFSNRISNYIFLQKLFDANGRPVEIVPGNFTYQYRQGSADLYGVEASWDLHPRTLHWFSAQQSLAFINGLNTDPQTLKTLGNEARYLPLIPPFKTNSRIRATFLSGIRKQEKGFLQLELETAATQNRFYAVDNTESATKGYMLLNFGAAVNLYNRDNKNTCTLNFSVNNIFDVAYQSHQNRLKYFEYYQVGNGPSGIYNMGRNIAVKFLVNW